MQVMTTLRESIQRIFGGNSSSSADHRQTFKDEFGFFPAPFEANEKERAQFAKESVEPVLQRRAATIQSLAKESADDHQGPVTDVSRAEKQAAFDRAYRIATQLKLADKGKTYQDYLATA